LLDGIGVKKDYLEAYAWLKLAKSAGADALGIFDRLVTRMSRHQVAEAEKRSKELGAIIELKTQK
jgi:TPR repeat protein